MSAEFQVTGSNENAPFTLKLHRGDGMTLVAMNWKDGKPPRDFVGFAIEYKVPGGDKFVAVPNRLGFPGGPEGRQPSTQAPIQKFRWVHFPPDAEVPGAFTYRVRPAFMDESGNLSLGEEQTAKIELRRETFPGQLNIAYTRGFVSSQAFVDRFEKFGAIKTLLPAKAEGGLKFKLTHPKADEALKWMGFEARSAIVELLDQAIADTTAEVRAAVYDLNEPDIVSKFEQLGSRLKIVIDDEGSHGAATSAETQAAKRLVKSAGKANVKRQHMGNLQHNKTIAVSGTVNKAVCGSTNLSWRGLYVQSNNAVIVSGEAPVKLFFDAFECYFDKGTVKDFGASPCAGWQDLELDKIDAKIAFSPHSKKNAVLKEIADDVEQNTKSSLFYSLAFLFQTPGAIKKAIQAVTANDKIFVYGISDKRVGGLDLQKPDGNVAAVFPAALSTAALPAPFSEEPTGGGGTRMHHKFLVVDFDKPSARVYFGSYNFSSSADTKNGENLVVIRDRRAAVSYMIEALRIFDHYHFRVAQMEADQRKERLELATPPKKKSDKPWFDGFWTDARKKRDRMLFA